MFCFDISFIVSNTVHHMTEDEEELNSAPNWWRAPVLAHQLHRMKNVNKRTTKPGFYKCDAVLHRNEI